MSIPVRKDHTAVLPCFVEGNPKPDIRSVSMYKHTVLLLAWGTLMVAHF
jgi:hypothetical protein